MTRALALVALAASVPLLAGCVAAPELPTPLTPAEVKQLFETQQAAWWTAMFPDEPQPVVEPIAYLPSDSVGAQVTQCMKDQQIENLIFSGNDSWSYASPDSASMDVVNRAWFTCSQQYPYDLVDSGFLSEDELEWIYDFNMTRLVPCLQLMGYPIVNRTLPYVPGSNDYWIPYYEMGPVPSEAEWARIDLRCPPSPVGNSTLYRPTSG